MDSAHRLCSLVLVKVTSGMVAAQTAPHNIGIDTAQQYIKDHT
jgi:hypothetical protein